MLKKIESLRKQPKHVRNRYAFWIALLVTLVIVTFWTTTLPARFSSENTMAEQDSEGGLSQDLGEISVRFKEMMGNMWSSVEYVQETEEPSPSNLLDLDALLASSSQAKTLSSSTPTTSAEASLSATKTATSAPKME